MVDLTRLAHVIAPSLVVVELPGRVCGAFLAAPGRLVTCVHPLAGDATATLRLPDATQWHVEDVLWMDPARDVMALPLPGGQCTPVTWADGREVVHEGTQLFAVQAPGSAQSITGVKVRSLHEVGGERCVAELDRSLPEGASGGPLLTAEGHVVGVVAAGLGEGGPLSLAVPLHAGDLLLVRREQMSLQQAWARLAQRLPRRAVPEHPLELLDGCSALGLRFIQRALTEAIGVGAPAYNRGDFEGCWRVYAAVAEKLVEQREDCPGAQQALRDGLAHALCLNDDNARAWAMRDAFDGLLKVIDAWLEQGGGGEGGGGDDKTWVN
ncbi:MAG: trypsin-like peptidase domain-containing protein [Deltaproteobacteria bacterium]|nr:trypsin-like peptidase domain-containing protein [Deltaproteobacteria bacterium]